MFLSMAILDKLFVLIAFILFYLSKLLVQIWNIKVIDRDRSSCDTQKKLVFSKQTLCKIV